MDKETEQLIQHGLEFAPHNVARLVEYEDSYAWGRKVNRFSHSLTKEQEHYLTYSSLPYLLGGWTRARLLSLWDVTISPLSPGGRISLPTGNLNAGYMVITDVPINTRVKKGRDTFDRACSCGIYAQVVREAMRELHLHTDVWYTSLVKAATPNMRGSTRAEVETHKGYLQREIEQIEPERLILIGKNTTKLYQQIYSTLRLPYSVVHHPAYYVALHKSNAAKMLANDLFTELF